MWKVTQESGTLLLLLLLLLLSDCSVGSRTNLVEAALVVSTTFRPVESTIDAALQS